MSEEITLADLDRAFAGVTPTIIATAASDGTPNVTYLSRLRAVDEHHVALSNQFFSKTSQNLTENPRASVVVFDPGVGATYRLTLSFRRTERDGPVFEQMRADVDATAALSDMRNVFRLRAADIYRVDGIVRLYGDAGLLPPARDASDALHAVATLGSRITACTTLDELVDTAVAGLGELLGYEHVNLMLLDEDGTSLYTLASRGFAAQGVGSEVAIGNGVIGIAAQQRTAVRVGNLRFMAKYARSLRRAWDEEHGASSAPRVPLPRLAGAQSRMVAPAMAFGHLVGVIVVDALAQVAFGPDDEAAVVTVASLFAPAFEALRADERAGAPTHPPSDPIGVPPASIVPRRSPATSAGATVRIRHYTVDGSTFLDGDYLIKGVPGRILWTLLRQHEQDGRVDFTNRELRLDQTLGMPAFNDNLESRLILLRRRLDERSAPITLITTGRGRFRIELSATVELDAAA